jgi:hypothetical protein
MPKKSRNTVTLVPGRKLCMDFLLMYSQAYNATCDANAL